MQGDPLVDKLMRPVLRSLDSAGISGNARADIYNRAYEAVMDSMTIVNTMRELLDKYKAHAERAEAMVERMIEAGNQLHDMWVFPDELDEVFIARQWNTLVDEWRKRGGR